MTLIFIFLLLFFVQLDFIRTVSSDAIVRCLSNATCGCSYDDVVATKIVGGEPAGINSWSWIVSIRVWNNHICGGSLISANFVLTAAHCLVSVTTKSSLSVTFGSKYLSVINQRRSIADVYLHRFYDSEHYIHDIALLRLSSPITVNDRNFITFICLPSFNNESYPPDDRPVVGIGWGVTSSDEKLSSNILQQVTLNTIATKTPTCRRTIYNERAQFCAGVREGGKDTCQGDSGGPLMMFNNGRWEIVGITSYGTGCALAEYAGVYTRVSIYLPWIKCFFNTNCSCMEEMFVMKTTFSSTSSFSSSPFLYLSILFWSFRYSV